MSGLAPGSLAVLRLPPALATAGLVILTGLIARELGGDRAAQVLAAASIAVSSLVLGAGHLLSTTALDLPLWALLGLLVTRILRTGDDRLWLAVGLAAGLGLLDSDLVAFLLFAIVAGLAVAGPRRPLRSGWLYAGAALAGLAWAPYLAWQASHGWPELVAARSIAGGGSGSSTPRWLLLPEQLALVSPYLCAVWLTGLVRLLRDRSSHGDGSDHGAGGNHSAGGDRGPRRYRALGVAYLVLAAVFLATGGKAYYLGGMFPLLLAAGAQPVADWMRRGRARLRRASATTAVAVGFDAGTLASICGSLRLAGHLSNHLGVSDDEQGMPVWVCSRLHRSWAAAWPGLRSLG